jgi:toxin ParE1/3/4
MALIRRSADARNDLIAIWAYIAQNNQSAADKLIEEIDRNLARLLKFPLLGEAVDHLRPCTRRVIVGNYQLFYEPSTDGIYLLRVYHSSRSIEDLFSS